MLFYFLIYQILWSSEDPKTFFLKVFCQLTFFSSFFDFFSLSEKLSMIFKWFLNIARMSQRHRSIVHSSGVRVEYMPKSSEHLNPLGGTSNGTGEMADCFQISHFFRWSIYLFLIRPASSLFPFFPPFSFEFLFFFLHFTFFHKRGKITRWFVICNIIIIIIILITQNLYQVY